MSDQTFVPVNLTPADFIRCVFLRDLKRMVYESRLVYLAFGVIAVGVEFLGACEDAEQFEDEGKSRARFARGIQRLAGINENYAKYNSAKSPYCLFKFLRCGTAHVMRPHGPIAFAERSNCATGSPHLTVCDGRLILVCEDFYDHFAQACTEMLEDPAVTNGPKFQKTCLSIGPDPMGPIMVTQPAAGPPYERVSPAPRELALCTT